MVRRLLEGIGQTEQDRLENARPVKVTPRERMGDRRGGRTKPPGTVCSVARLRRRGREVVPERGWRRNRPPSADAVRTLRRVESAA